MHRRFASTLALLPLLLVSCRDATIVTYTVPKESPAPTAESGASPSVDAPAPPADMAANAGAIPATTGMPELTWTAPASWQQKPGSSLRKGSYLVGDPAGPNADLSITVFPGDVGGDLANVNRWRSQIGLAPITAAELPSALNHVDSAGLHIDYVELAHNGTRVLAAIVPHEGATWFVKLTGPDSLVAAQKLAFIEFLRTLRPAA